MTDPRGILGVPEGGSRVPPTQRVQRIDNRRRRPQDEQRGRRRPPQRPAAQQRPDDDQPHVDYLA